MLKTEERNPNSTHIDTMTFAEMADLMAKENFVAVEAVARAKDSIAAAAEAIAARMRRGGRLFYIGAGTSGRIGIADAAECPPTYGISPDRVVGIMAGQKSGAVSRAKENAEDDGAAGRDDLAEYSLTEADSVIGTSAAGGAAYVAEALAYADACGALTVALTSNAGTKITKVAKLSIVTDTGAEVITGSTRMKAGTAQKLVLNMISTSVMVSLGYVYENLMIHLKPSNEKLRARVIGIYREITGAAWEDAVSSLDAAEWNLRAAIDAYQASCGGK